MPGHTTSAKTPNGSRVFMRNRGIKGCNKIQDLYGDKPYEVMDRRQDQEYITELLAVEGP